MTSLYEVAFKFLHQYRDYARGGGAEGGFGPQNFGVQKGEQKEKQTIYHYKPPQNQNPNVVPAIRFLSKDCR